MNKLLAVIKREYLQRVRTKLFVIMTVIGPALLLVFTVVPGLLMTIKTSTARIAVIDQTDGAKLFEPVRDSLVRPEGGNEKGARQNLADNVTSNRSERIEKTTKSLTGNFRVESASLKGRSLDDVKQELNKRIAKEELEGYLIIPADILTNSKSNPVYYGRNMSDLITRGQIEKGINSAVRRQRLIAAGVNEHDIEQLSQSVDLQV